MSRYADFDAARERRGPMQFKMFGTNWLIPPMSFRKVATISAVILDAATAVATDGGTVGEVNLAEVMKLADVEDDMRAFLISAISRKQRKRWVELTTAPDDEGADGEGSETDAADDGLGGAEILGLVEWIITNDIGRPFTLVAGDGEDGAPLGQSSASSPASAPNGLSPVGVSPPSG